MYISYIFLVCNGNEWEFGMRNKRAKFVELATKRVNRTIKDIKLIGNLSNRSAYEYSEDDAKKIIRALQREIETVRLKFSGGGSGGDDEFQL